MNQNWASVYFDVPLPFKYFIIVKNPHQIIISNKIDPENLLPSSLKILNKDLANTISTKHPLRIRYASPSSGVQQGQDDGGLCRDWFHILSQEIVLPKYSLFHPGEHSFTGRYQLETSPNSSSSFVRSELCKMLGRMIAICLILDVPLTLDFVPSFYKALVGEEPDFSDLQFIDSSLVRYQPLSCPLQSM